MNANTAKTDVTLNDCFVFTDQRVSGAATLVEPMVSVCSHCQGLDGVMVWSDEEQGRVVVPNPELAVQVSLVLAGYHLAQNEARANYGAFATFDGHDGDYPDSWQSLPTSNSLRPCSCAAAKQEAA